MVLVKVYFEKAFRRDRHRLVSSIAGSSKTKITSTDRVCQGRIIDPRCHLDSRLAVRLRVLTYPRQLTCAERRRILGASSFDCALRGPFDGLYPARFSASRALCEALSRRYFRINGLLQFPTFYHGQGGLSRGICKKDTENGILKKN